ncbi:MAG: hypothetical protein BWY72_00501 [Bacteroidetes bacterium ADurb.Bin416]|nr:MAG: hypothetical protein BWY72_00501 [Bacteroidetes bacterium ADurb.Bin416]
MIRVGDGIPFKGCHPMALFRTFLYHLLIPSIPLPLAGLGIASSSVPQSLRPLDTGADCLSL